MRKKVVIIIVCFIIALVFMSSGYSKWSKKMVIEGDITVVPTTTTSAVVGIEFEDDNDD